MKLIFALATLLAFASCTADHNQTAAPPPAAPSQNSEPMERALIVGSAEAPDPVLTRVRELEKDGVVKDVVVLESFPVQIRLSAPKRIIEELNRIPRVGLR
jgi:uncharacterized lipoprotein YajG